MGTEEEKIISCRSSVIATKSYLFYHLPDVTLIVWSAMLKNRGLWHMSAGLEVLENTSRMS